MCIWNVKEQNQKKHPQHVPRFYSDTSKYLVLIGQKSKKRSKAGKIETMNVSLRKLQNRILTPENYICVRSVETMDDYSRRLCCWMLWTFVFMYLSLLRTRSKLNSWRYWMSGPRQLITGLSRDATLDREREPGGHTHKNMQHFQHQHTAMSHEPTPQTHLLCSQWQDVSNWGDRSVTGKIKALQWHNHTPFAWVWQ